MKSINSVKYFYHSYYLRVWKDLNIVDFYLKSIWTTMVPSKTLDALKLPRPKYIQKKIVLPSFIFAKVSGKGWSENRQWLPNFWLKSIPSCSSTNFSLVGHSCLSPRETERSRHLSEIFRPPFSQVLISHSSHICSQLEIKISFRCDGIS